MALVLQLVLIIAILGLAFSVEFRAIEKIPKNWFIADASIPGARDVRIKVALHPRDAATLERRLLDIATPGSSSFRKYLNKDQITEIVGRTQSDLDRVTNWFTAHGAVDVQVHPHRDWLIVSTSIAKVEEMFNCKLAKFMNSANGKAKIAAWGSYTVPDEIADVVHFVSGLSTLPASRWEALEVAPEQVGAVGPVTPDTIYNMYQSDFTGSHGSKLGSQAVVEFGQFANFNEADLQTFFKQYQRNLTGEVCGMVYGENNGQIRGSVEANLDVQYIMAAGPFVNTTDYKIVSTEGIEDQFLDYTIEVNGENQPPLVHSISYGEYGGSYDNVTDQRFSYELQKMGISGVSVLLASGDNGVGCNDAGTSQEFDYPSSPYITMVGATYVDTTTGKEVGATLSSGGFSKDFWQASWQADAVNGYFNSGVALPKEDYFRNGRAYPDVAAFGQNVMVISEGKAKPVSGTSCSAPIFAGLIANINHELMSQGEAPLGWLNPWLYANPTAFTDVTGGNNAYQKCSGFNAAPGWDPVTGLGTPIYPKLLNAAFDALKVKK